MNIQCRSQFADQELYKILKIIITVDSLHGYYPSFAFTVESVEKNLIIIY